MKISETVEALAQLKRVYGDVEVVMEDPIYGVVPAVVGVTIDRGIKEVLIEPED